MLFTEIYRVFHFLFWNTFFSQCTPYKYTQKEEIQISSFFCTQIFTNISHIPWNKQQLQPIGNDIPFLLQCMVTCSSKKVKDICSSAWKRLKVLCILSPCTSTPPQKKRINKFCSLLNNEYFSFQWKIKQHTERQRHRGLSRFQWCCISCHGWGPCTWHKPQSLQRPDAIHWHSLNEVPGCQPTAMLDKRTRSAVLKRACGNAWEWGQI